MLFMVGVAAPFVRESKSRIIRLKRDALGEVGDRPVVVALVSPSLGAVKPAAEVIRIERNGLVAIGDRPVVIALVMISGGTVAVGDGGAVVAQTPIYVRSTDADEKVGVVVFFTALLARCAGRGTVPATTMVAKNTGIDSNALPMDIANLLETCLFGVYAWRCLRFGARAASNPGSGRPVLPLKDFLYHAPAARCRLGAGQSSKFSSPLPHSPSGEGVARQVGNPAP